MQVTYSKANRGDFERINELFMEMLRTIYQTDQVNGYCEGDMDRFFDGRDEWICTALEGDTIIAFLSIEVHHEAEAFIYLDDLSVTAEYRNKGIGTTLIHRAEEYAKELGIATIRLHVEKSNTSAYQLYERVGYLIQEDQGTRYLMSRQL